MKEETKLTEKDLADAYPFLNRKVHEEHAKNYAPIVSNLRNAIVRERYPLSTRDMARLDLLLVEAYQNDETLAKARPAFEEAYALVQNEASLSPKEAMELWGALAMDANLLEDWNRAYEASDEASYFAHRAGEEAKAIAWKKDQIALAWRFEETEREKKMPSYEELVLLFGKANGTALFASEKQVPAVMHDPVETNPFYVKVIDSVNERIRAYFVAYPQDFTEDKFNALKQQYLREEGLLWLPPRQA